ncbi:MAG TPA: hypothetical protein VGN08_14000 [Solirubrobacteraceae bacterium]
MSQRTNIATLRAFADAWNPGEPDWSSENLERVDAELEIDSPLSALSGKPYRGIDGARKWLSDIDDQFDVWEGRDYEFRPVGDDRLLVFNSIHARGRESGVELDWRIGMLADFRDGRLLRLKIFRDRAEALEAVGLEE